MTTQNGENVVNVTSLTRFFATSSADNVDYRQHTIILMLRVTQVTGSMDVFASGIFAQGSVLLMKFNPGGGYICRGHHLRTGSSNAFDSASAWPISYIIFVQRADDTRLHSICDGIVTTVGPIPSGAQPQFNRGIALQSRDTALRGGNGDYGEVLVYDRYLADTELNALGNSLALKWNANWVDISV